MRKLLVLVLVVMIMMIAAIPALAGRRGHQVSAGGPDACEGFGLSPGCDASFSMVANERPDGSVSGQYNDQFGNGGGGLHAVIDCLYVDGNQAWVSGVITHETISEDGSLVGLAISTRVKDNGTSANDSPDQISFSFMGGDAFICTDHPDVGLFDAPQGQVNID